MLVKFANQIFDFFYPYFNTFFDKTTFKYAVCGVSNMLLGWILFFVFYNFVFDKQFFYIETLNYTLSPYTISAFICFLMNFFLGFTLMRYLVFTESSLRGRHQLIRYAISACISAFSSWILLKIFIENFHFFPSIANVASTIIVVVISYFLQKKFSFK